MPNDPDWFSPKEAKARFEALLTAGLHTPPMPKLKARNQPPPPEIHELTTEEMQRRAEAKRRAAKKKYEALD